MKSFVIATCLVLFCINIANVHMADIRMCEEGQTIIYTADLSSGIDTIESQDDVTKSLRFDIDYRESLSKPSDTKQRKCNLQGVLKLTFPDAISDEQKKMLQFDLEFDPSLVSGTAFHIGDSLTNRRMVGDDGINDTPFVGEAFTQDQTWIVHSNAQAQPPFVIVEEPNYITNYVTVLLGDEYIASRSSISVNDPNANTLEFPDNFVPAKFVPAALRGQAPDYDIAVGLNRPIDGEDLTGAGLCRITITACDVQKE